MESISNSRTKNTLQNKTTMRNTRKNATRVYIGRRTGEVIEVNKSLNIADCFAQVLEDEENITPIEVQKAIKKPVRPKVPANKDDKRIFIGRRTGKEIKISEANIYEMLNNKDNLFPEMSDDSILRSVDRSKIVTGNDTEKTMNKTNDEHGNNNTMMIENSKETEEKVETHNTTTDAVQPEDSPNLDGTAVKAKKDHDESSLKFFGSKKQLFSSCDQTIDIDISQSNAVSTEEDVDITGIDIDVENVSNNNTSKEPQSSNKSSDSTTDQTSISVGEEMTGKNDTKPNVRQSGADDSDVDIDVENFTDTTAKSAKFGKSICQESMIEDSSDDETESGNSINKTTGTSKHETRSKSIRNDKKDGEKSTNKSGNKSKRLSKSTNSHQRKDEIEDESDTQEAHSTNKSSRKSTRQSEIKATKDTVNGIQYEESTFEILGKKAKCSTRIIDIDNIDNVSDISFEMDESAVVDVVEDRCHSPEYKRRSSQRTRHQSKMEESDAVKNKYDQNNSKISSKVLLDSTNAVKENYGKTTTVEAKDNEEDQITATRMSTRRSTTRNATAEELDASKPPNPKASRKSILKRQVLTNPSEDDFNENADSDHLPSKVPNRKSIRFSKAIRSNSSQDSVKELDTMNSSNVSVNSNTGKKDESKDEQSESSLNATKKSSRKNKSSNSSVFEKSSIRRSSRSTNKRKMNDTNDQTKISKAECDVEEMPDNQNSSITSLTSKNLAVDSDGEVDGNDNDGPEIDFDTPGDGASFEDNKTNYGKEDTINQCQSDNQDDEDEDNRLDAAKSSKHDSKNKTMSNNDSRLSKGKQTTEEMDKSLKSNSSRNTTRSETAEDKSEYASYEADESQSKTISDTSSEQIDPKKGTNKNTKKKRRKVTSVVPKQLRNSMKSRAQRNKSLKNSIAISEGESHSSSDDGSQVENQKLNTTRKGKKDNGKSLSGRRIDSEDDAPDMASIASLDDHHTLEDVQVNESGKGNSTTSVIDVSTKGNRKANRKRGRNTTLKESTINKKTKSKNRKTNETTKPSDNETIPDDGTNFSKTESNDTTGKKKSIGRRKRSNDSQSDSSTSTSQSERRKKKNQSQSNMKSNIESSIDDVCPDIVSTVQDGAPAALNTPVMNKTPFLRPEIRSILKSSQTRSENTNSPNRRVSISSKKISKTNSIDGKTNRTGRRRSSVSFAATPSFRFAPDDVVSPDTPGGYSKLSFLTNATDYTDGEETFTPGRSPSSTLSSIGSTSGLLSDSSTFNESQEITISNAKRQQYEECQEDLIRRSKRTKVPPLKYWVNERIKYKRRKSGFYISEVEHVQTPKVPKRKPRKTTKKKTVSTKTVEYGGYDDNGPHTLSDIPSDFMESPVKPITVVNPYDNQEVDIDLMHTPEMLHFVNPSHEPAKPDDPLAIDKYMSHNAFGLGQLILRPNAEKGMQHVRQDTMAFHVLTGQVEATIHQSTILLPAGSTFFVPEGNLMAELAYVSKLRALIGSIASREHVQVNMSLIKTVVLILKQVSFFLGNNYNLKNINDTDTRLFFVQIKSQA